MQFIPQVFVLSFLALNLSVSIASAGTLFTIDPTLAQYGILTSRLDSPSGNSTNPLNPGIIGNVGIYSDTSPAITGTADVVANQRIAGRLDFGGSSAGTTVPLASNVSGGIHQGVGAVDIAEAAMRSLVSSLNAIGYTPHADIGGIPLTTINVGNTATALRIASLNLGAGEVLQIIGAAGSQVVINVTSFFQIGGGNSTQGITLSGGIRPEDVIFFYSNTASGASQDIKFNGNAGAIDNFSVKAR